MPEELIEKRRRLEEQLGILPALTVPPPKVPKALWHANGIAIDSGVPTGLPPFSLDPAPVPFNPYRRVFDRPGVEPTEDALNRAAILKKLDIPITNEDPLKRNAHVKDWLVTQEVNDPAFGEYLRNHSTLEQKQALLRAGNFLYAITQREPSKRERREAFDESLSAWANSEIYAQDTTGLGYEGYGETVPSWKKVRDPIAPSYDSTDLYKQFLNWEINKNDPQDPNKRLIFDFFKKHQSYFVSRQRLQHLLELPTPDKQTTFQLKIRDNLLYEDNLPPNEFHYKNLISVSPTLQIFSSQVDAYAQQKATAPQFSLLESQTAPAINGVFYSEKGLPITGFLDVGAPLTATIDPEKSAQQLEQVLGAFGNAFNVVTLGLFEAIPDMINESIGPGLAKIFTGDARNFDLYVKSLPKRAFLSFMHGFDPKGTEKDQAHAQFMRDYLPTGDPKNELYQENRWTSAISALQNFARREDETQPGPYTKVFANLLGGVIDDGTRLITYILGGTALNRLISGPKQPKVIKTPLTKGKTQAELVRQTNLEKSLEAANQSSEIPALARSFMLEEIEGSLEKLKDPSAANELVSRLKTLVEDGAIDSEITASFVETVRKLEETIHQTAGTRISSEGRRALAELPKQLPDIGFADLYGIHNNYETIHPQVSRLLVEPLKKFFESIKRDPDTKIPKLVRTYKPIDYKKLSEQLHEQRYLIDLTAKRKARFNQLTSDLSSKLTRELYTTQTQLEANKLIRSNAIKAYNQSLLDIFNNWKIYEFEGGYRPSANPSIRRSMYRDLLDVQQNIVPVDEFIKNEKIFKEIAGDQAKSLKADLEAGGLSAINARTEILSRVNRRLFEDSRPSYEPINPAEKPSFAFRNDMEKKLKDAALQPEPIKLSQAEIKELYKYTLNPPDYKKVPVGFKHIKAVDKDISDFTLKVTNLQQDLTDIGKFREYLRTVDPLKPNQQIKISASLRNRLKEHFANPGWVTIQDNSYASLTPGMADRTALQALDEAISTLSADAEMLAQYGKQFSSVDFAVAAAHWPEKVPFMLNEELNLAKARRADLLRWASWAIKKYGKKFTPEDMIELFYANKENRIFKKDPEFQNLINQEQRMYGLHQSYLSGRLSKADLEGLKKNLTYYHGVYDREEFAALGDMNPFPFKKPPIYNELKTIPGEFMPKIPNDPFYIAYRPKKGKPVEVLYHSKERKGFDTKEAAEAYLNSEAAKARLPKKAWVTIRPGWSEQARTYSNLITEAGTSHLDLMRRIAHNNAVAHVNRAISHSPYARRTPLPDSKVAETHFIDPQDIAWFKVTDPKIPHLNGLYVNEKILDWLRSQNEHLSWTHDLLNTIEKRHNKFTNELIPWSTRIAETAFGRNKPLPSRWNRLMIRSGYVMGTAHVAYSLWMLLKQMSSNLLINLPLGGMNTYNPLVAAKLPKYFYRALRAARKDPFKDWGWNFLSKRNLIEFDQIAYDQLMESSFSKNFKSLEAHQARLTRLETQLDGIQKNYGKDHPDFVKGIGYKQQLEAEIKNLSPKHVNETIGALLDGAWKGLKGTVDTLSGGQTRWNERLFKLVSLPDTICKYALACYLKELGVAESQIALSIRYFMQNLDKVPEAAKLMSQRFGGSKFVTYPFNQARVMGYALQHRKAFLMKYFLGRTIWNYSMLSASTPNPEETLEVYGRDTWGERNILTDFLFLNSRLMLPSGDYINADPDWGWLLPQSRIARGLHEALTEQDPEQPQHADHVASTAAKMALTGATGLASKFFAGQPFVNIATDIISGKDYRGNPVTWSNFYETIIRTFTPSMTPGLPGVYEGGSDWKEFHDWATTPYLNVQTGEQREITDHILRRAFSIVPKKYLDSTYKKHRLIQEALDAGNPAAARLQSRLKFEERAQNYVWARGGKDNPELSKQLYQEWYSQPDVERSVFEDIKKLTPRQIEERLKYFDYPAIIRKYKDYDLSQKIRAWGEGRAIDSNPTDPKVEKNLSKMISYSIENSTFYEDEVSENITPIFTRLLFDPRLSDPDKQLLRKWQEEISRRVDRQDRNRARRRRTTERNRLRSPPLHEQLIK